jgi:hypothetical protein
LVLYGRRVEPSDFKKGSEMKQYIVEVQADSTGTWAGNGKRFATEGEAKEYALDLYRRWSAVKEWRIVEKAKAMK